MLVPRPLTETDWAALLEPVARELLGDPVRRPSSGEWRYRRKGSLAVHVAGPRRGTWRDHEADVGGGVLELLAHVEGLNRPEALEWLRHRGLLDGPRTDAGRGASRFSGRAAARHRTLPKNGSTGLSGPGENPARAEKRDVRLDRAVKMWERAGAVPAAADHPARRWLARRRLWRPGQPLPPSVRWVAAPGPSVGAIVAAFAPPGTGRLSGVQLIHVDADGLPALDKPGPDGLPKRSFGQMAGAVCVLGLQGHGGVNVAEGLADALALAARLPWRAVCMGGTAGFHNLELARWLAGSGTVHIWADQHAPGFAAAEILGRMIVGEANTTVSVEHVGVGEDPGAAGAPFAPLDAPTFEALAADLQREGLPAWEAARVASTITN